VVKHLLEAVEEAWLNTFSRQWRGRGTHLLEDVEGAWLKTSSR